MGALVLQNPTQGKKTIRLKHDMHLSEVTVKVSGIGDSYCSRGASLVCLHRALIDGGLLSFRAGLQGLR